MIQRHPHASDRSRASQAPALDRDIEASYVALWRGLLPLLPTVRAALGVASVHSRAGVTTVATHLALAASGMDLGPVLLIESSPHRSGLPELLEVQANPGLSDWLRNSAELDSCLQEIIPDRLTILTAGSPDDESSHPVSRLAALETLRDRFALVICDLGAASQPVFPAELIPAMDGILLVIEANRVTETEACQCRDRWLAQGGRLLGAIWNETPRQRP